jgi:hypothetical protein
MLVANKTTSGQISFIILLVEKYILLIFSCYG